MTKFVEMYDDAGPKAWRNNFVKKNGRGPFEVRKELSTQLWIVLPNGELKLVNASYFYYVKEGVLA